MNPNINPNNVIFFCDFIIYLNYVMANKIKLTKTGNISIFDIDNLSRNFKYQKLQSEFKEYGWKIRNEQQFEYLHKIRIISEAMYLTYKRKGTILLSKNGNAYLKNIDSLSQYWNMVTLYWEKINWDYFEPARNVHGVPFATFFQNNQKIIWDYLLKNGETWINFNDFLKALKIYFHLDKYYSNDQMDDFDFRLNVEYCLIRRNLHLFGCVEIEEKEDKYMTRITRFKPTDLGTFMFKKALFPLC